MEIDEPPNCLLCKKPCDECDRTDSITNDKWLNIKKKTLAWKGLDKYGEAHDTTRWDNGPAGYFMHTSCHTTLSNSSKLKQAIKRKEKLSSVREEERQKENVGGWSSNHEEEQSSKRRRSEGSLHDKTKCVWCFYGEDTKHPDRKFSKLLLSLNV